MTSFFRRLFTRNTVENRLLLALLPVIIILLVLDQAINDLRWSLPEQGITKMALKILLAIPVLWYVIRSLSGILESRLSSTRLDLERSEERFRTIFQNNSSAIMIIETDSTVSMINDAYCQMTGYCREEVIGKSWIPLVAESEIERLMRYNRLRLQGAKDIPNVYEFSFKKKNGELRVGLMSVFFDKFLNQIVISITDITSRKEMEINLTNSEERYRNLVDLQGEGLVIVDQDEKFLFTNPAADRIMGVPVGSLVGRKLDEFVDKQTFELLRKQTSLRTEGRQSSYEMEITRDDGEKRIIFVTATPKLDSRGVFISSIGLLVDITDRKKIENDLKESEAKLKSLNTTKDKLFSIIAHDLRGPIGTAADLLDVLLENYESFSSEEQIKMLEILKNSATSTYNLLETLLNWSIIQTGDLNYRPEFFNLTGSIDSIVKNMTPAAYSKDISLVFEPERDIFTYADQNMMQTVFRNLLGNAIKYTFRGGRIEVTATVMEGKIHVVVSDNGMGMDEETTKNLFVLSKKKSRYGTENEKGTGLGLILVKEFIEKHGGHIRVESVKGEGSRFCFDIPAAEEGTFSVKPVQTPETVLKNMFNQENILVVEDDDINYQVLSSILNGVNLRYERAVNGREAVDMFLNNTYRLILMDIQLPEMNGWEATMKIRENDSEIPIIAVTAFASDPTRKKSIEAGCNDFITKPINKTKLVQVIGKYLYRNRIGSVLYK